jgi:fructokinase
MTARHRIGVDLGGTKIEAIVVGNITGEEPEILARARIPTDRSLGYEHILQATRGLIFQVAREADIHPLVTPIGVGMPGSSTMKRIDGTKSELPLVKNSNTTCLNGQPFRADLSRVVGSSIAFANDANCFALAEATWGAARGARVTFGVIMGTGVGGGIVIADDWAPRVWEGSQGIAGEWGHVPLNPDQGPQCYCGKRGCVETYLSGPAIEAEYKNRGGAGRLLVDIAARGASGEDVIARKLLAERMDIFGRAMALVINVLDPDIIVLGGGVSNVASFYDKGPRAIARWIFNDDLTTRIVKNTLGDSAGVLGAALLPNAVSDAPNTLREPPF